MRVNGIMKLVGWIVLVALGYLIGTGATFLSKTPEDKSDVDPMAEPPSYEREVSPRTDLTQEEMATIKLFEDAAPSVAFISTSN